MSKKMLFFMCCTTMLHSAQVDDPTRFREELLELFRAVQKSPCHALTIFHTSTGIGFAQAAQTLTELTGDQKYVRNAEAILAKQSNMTMPTTLPMVDSQTTVPTPIIAWTNTPVCPEHALDIHFASPATPTHTNPLSQSCPQLPTTGDESSSYIALADETKKSPSTPTLYKKLIECCLRKKR